MCLECICCAVAKLWPTPCNPTNCTQHARPPCPSPTPGVHSNSCPWSRWCHPAISSSVAPFSSCPQFFPASGGLKHMYVCIYIYIFLCLCEVYLYLCTLMHIILLNAYIIFHWTGTACVTEWVISNYVSLTLATVNNVPVNIVHACSYFFLFSLR